MPVSRNQGYFAPLSGAAAELQKQLGLTHLLRVVSFNIWKQILCD
jgi:hypothetical protein